MKINFPENLKVGKCCSTCSFDPIKGEINIFFNTSIQIIRLHVRVVTNRTGLVLFSTFK